MARTFEENMKDKKLTVKSLRVLQEVEGGAFDKISSQIEKTNQTIATLQGAQNRYWDSIADDNIITAEEKRILYKEKQTLDTEYSIVIQNAEKNKDYVDYSSLTEAYQNLNSYLAFIKLFENLGSNTKIDNRTEFYDAFDSYYIALNNVNQAILNKASVGDINVDKPDKITGVKAVASEKGIYVSFNQLSSEVKNNIGKYIYKLNKGDGVIYLFESQINGFTYEFDRLVDGFPEAEDIKDWEWTVSAVSVYGKEGEESRSVNTNIDTYGTWIPNKDDINIIVSSNKRHISFSFNRIVTNKILYGQIQFGLLVQRIDIDGENFYTPALDKNPILSEENYKQETTEPLYVTSYFSQTVPLAGQNNKKWRKKYYETREGEDGTKADSVSYSDTLPAYPDNAVITYDDKGNIICVSYNDTVETFTQHYEYTLVDMPSPVDTTYKYKIDVWNKDTDLHYDILNSLAVIATANSASDLVDNAITQNALAPEAVTADKIAVGTITAEQIAAEDILVKGARAGMVSTEGLIVDNSAFLASKTLPYKWTDPETGEEKTYIAKSGEFFVGNSPDVNDNRDIVDFLHYLPGVGFWFKIKNFIVKGIATIIQNVFRVKKSGAEDSESFFTVNSTDKMDEETFTPARTVSVKGTVQSNKIVCPSISLKETVSSLSRLSITNKILKKHGDFFIYTESNYVYVCRMSSSNLSEYEILYKFFYWEPNNPFEESFKDFIVDGEIILIVGFFGGSNVIKITNAQKLEELWVFQYRIICYVNKYKGKYLVGVRSSENGSPSLKISFFLWDLETSVVFLNKTADQVTDLDSLIIEEYDNKLFVAYSKQTSTSGIVDNYRVDIFDESFKGIFYRTTGFLVKAFFYFNNNIYILNNINSGTEVYTLELNPEENYDNSFKYKLKAFYENISADDFVFDETTQKLYAMKEKLIIFDGTSFSEEEFLPEFSKKLIAISNTHYLFMNMENNEYLSVKRDNKFLPIISDEDVTEKNTWSAKKIEQELETEKTERQSDAANLLGQIDLFAALKKEPFLLDDENTTNFTLVNGGVYIYINTHVDNLGEVVMLTYYQLGGYITRKVISSGSIATSITHKGNGVVTFTSSWVCRGHLYRLVKVRSI